MKCLFVLLSDNYIDDDLMDNIQFDDGSLN